MFARWRAFCGFGSLSNFICFTSRLNRIWFRRFFITGGYRQLQNRYWKPPDSAV